MIRLLCFVLAMSLGALGNARAQSRDDVTTRLDRAARVAAWPQAIRDSLVPPRWLRYGERLVFWNATGPMAGTWVMVDAARGERRPIITPAALRRRLAALTGQDAALPAQMSFVLAQNNRGLLFSHTGTGFRLDFADPNVRRIEKGGMDERLLAGGVASPDGSRIVSQEDDGFAVSDETGRTVMARTGTPDLAWQLPERPWSPDGRLAVWLIDSRMVHHIPVVDYAASTEQVTMVPYAKVGTPIAEARLHLFDPATGELQPISGEQDEGYDWLAGWRDDGAALVLHLARDGKRLDLLTVARGGHSWGGYFAIRAMLVAPDTFKAGYAGAPGALDEDALVNEPDMGMPGANLAGYAAGSNLALAGKLAGPLRIMHGTADVNAPLSSSMRMVDALIRANRQVELLTMPGIDHNPEGAAEAYYRDDVIRFFLRTL